MLGIFYYIPNLSFSVCKVLSWNRCFIKKNSMSSFTLICSFETFLWSPTVSNSSFQPLVVRWWTPRTSSVFWWHAASFSSPLTPHHQEHAFMFWSRTPPRLGPLSARSFSCNVMIPVPPLTTLQIHQNSWFRFYSSLTRCRLMNLVNPMGLL